MTSLPVMSNHLWLKSLHWKSASHPHTIFHQLFLSGDFRSRSKLSNNSFQITNKTMETGIKSILACNQVLVLSWMLQHQYWPDYIALKSWCHGENAKFCSWVPVNGGSDLLACHILDPGELHTQQDELSLNGDEDSYRKGQPHAEVQMSYDSESASQIMVKKILTTQQDQN